MPRVTVEAGKENAIEPTVAAQVDTSLQDRAQRHLANVEPALIGAALGPLADDRLRELTGIGAPALPCSRHEVANGGNAAAAQLLQAARQSSEQWQRDDIRGANKIERCGQLDVETLIRLGPPAGQ